jgi:hypothetical protein
MRRSGTECFFGNRGAKNGAPRGLRNKGIPAKNIFGIFTDQLPKKKIIIMIMIGLKKHGSWQP